MKREMIVAGHGGQGVLELANWLAYFHFLEGRHVAYTPSYGPETRGGKVKCYVVASDEPIDSPIVEEPDLLVAMNIPSMDFVPLLRPGGTLLVNSSLVSDGPPRTDLRVERVPAAEIAAGLTRFLPEGARDASIAANSVMLGALFGVTGEDPDRARTAVDGLFRHFLTDRKAAYVPLNVHAVDAGLALLGRRPVPA